MEWKYLGWKGGGDWKVLEGGRLGLSFLIAIGVMGKRDGCFGRGGDGKWEMKVCYGISLGSFSFPLYIYISFFTHKKKILG